jgi:PAS domain S-box-containing protein
MNREDGASGQEESLYRQAEGKVTPPLSLIETNQLLHELRAHQIELELQVEEMHRNQKDLETSRAFYFDLYNLSPVGNCIIDKQGLILDANLTAATMLGVERRELVNHSISSFISPEDLGVYSLHHKQLLETALPQTCELRIRRPSAAIFWARLEANLTYSADGSSLCRIVFSDISDRKLMVESLRKSEEKYRTVADFTHAWEFWLDPEDNFLYCSPSCHRITGYSAVAFEKEPSLLRSLIHPDDLAAYDEHQQAAKGQSITQEIEFRIIHADDATRWRRIAHFCQPIYGEHGQFLGTRGSNRDITEYKRLENEAAKVKNLESLGILAGGIAHDFNNLFQALLGNFTLAKMYTEKSSKAFQFLDNAEQVYELAIKLTGQLIAFSPGGGISTMMNIQPSRYIREEAVSTLHGSGLVVEFDLADNLWPINIDLAQFRDVIKYMVLNAMEAMIPESGGNLKIIASNETLGETQKIDSTLAPGHYVRISIQDQGCGITKENLRSIFDPYFSSKQRGCQKGMGLGLSLCNSIISKHDGAITVSSKTGQGTTFNIYLPAVVAAAKKTEVTKDQQAQGPRILLMDDDIGVVQVTSNYLRSSGYRIDSTLDGDATILAFQEARSAGDPYVLVILDLTIPGGMGGKDVVNILKEIDPEVKAIVSSGYASDPTMTAFADYGFVAACAKPCLLSEMKAIINRFV